MTTNVLDTSAGVLASDSRWSIDTPAFVAFVDDTGFDKIAVYRHLGFMFAGSSMLIQGWKDWIANNPSSGDELPAVECEGEAMALSITDLERRTVMFEHGQDIQHPVARFAGTGSRHAFLCWNANGCAKKAVESAKIMDCYSGGEVKYLHCVTLQHNLSNSVSFQIVGTKFLEKGMIMYKGNGAGVIPFKEAAANDSAVERLRQDIASGKAVASAPCDAMYNSWTPAEKSRLGRVLNQALQVKK